MKNETKREILLSLSLMCFSIGAIIFIYNVALHWEPFWSQLKLYWMHIALFASMGFLLLLARRDLPKKSNLPDKITAGKFYAGRTLGRQHKRW